MRARRSSPSQVEWASSRNTWRTAQGPINLSSMVFQPGKRALHIAMGKVPAAQGPFVLLDRKCLFSSPPVRKKI